MSPERGYLEALEILKSRFGNQFHLKEAWLRKVTDGLELKSNNKEQLEVLTDDIYHLAAILRTTGYGPDIYADRVIDE